MIVVEPWFNDGGSCQRVNESETKLICSASVYSILERPYEVVIER